MPLKYKKLIVIFTLAIMFIGLGTFSLLAPSFHFDFGGKDSAQESDPIEEEIKVPDGKTESDVESEISLLVSNYFDAKQRVDMEELEECVSDISHIEEKRLVTEASYIEAYKNIDCTILNGYEEGSYRVYVYYDVKIYDIDTMVPSLTALYITLTSDDTFQIYMSTVDGDTQKYIDSLDSSDSIQKMASSVQKKLEEIVSSNEDVREFYEMLENADEEDDSEDITDIEKEGGAKATATPK